MADMVQTVQLLAGLGSCAVVLVRLRIFSRVARLVQAREPVTSKPCPQCQAPVHVPRRAGSVPGLKVQCPQCQARLVCRPKAKQ